MSDELCAFASGALLAGGLIVAIGPQNLHVLRVALARRHVTAVVVLCVAADALLIAAAVAGATEALQAQPAWLWALQWAAVPLLLWMAAGSARAALAPGPLGVADLNDSPSLRMQLGRTAALTFGNPSVWIETVLIVGAAAAAQADDTLRWSFAAGACVASACWFGALGYGAGALARALRRPEVLRSLSALSAALLALSAWDLARGGVA
jgi:L-lysine exporter family protein LysE/ArgO